VYLVRSNACASGHGGWVSTGVWAQGVRSEVLAKILGFLRAGHREGVPGPYSFLRLRLSDDDVVALQVS
jgi:hypothetical protein